MSPASMGIRLAKLRRERGWTQEALADRARLRRETIGRLEAATKKTRRPSLRTLEKLAKALDVSMGELLG
jgi:transcriptional regulator with XRE-family HTH domain